jgi:hypothetical protein
MNRIVVLTENRILLKSQKARKQKMTRQWTMKMKFQLKLTRLKTQSQKRTKREKRLLPKKTNPPKAEDSIKEFVSTEEDGPTRKAVAIEVIKDQPENKAPRR